MWCHLNVCGPCLWINWFCHKMPTRFNSFYREARIKGGVRVMVVFEHIYLAMIKNLWHDALTSFMHLNYFKSILFNLGTKNRKNYQIEFCSKYGFRFQKSLHSHWKFFVRLHFWFYEIFGPGNCQLDSCITLIIYSTLTMAC